MQTFVVLFTDNPDRTDMRDQHMSEHLEFLEANSARIRAAGPLRNEASGEPGGGLWLVDANSREDVDALIRRDPFWPTGLRNEVTVLFWKRVFADGRRCI